MNSLSLDVNVLVVFDALVVTCSLTMNRYETSGAGDRCRCGLWEFRNHLDLELESG
jgi:hypothetical protein